MSYQFELALRKFIAAFDGTNSISQADFQSRFDNLHHKNFTLYPKDEKVTGEDGLITVKSQVPLTRNEVFESWSKRLASGTKITLIHFRKIGLDCIDIKIRQVTGQEEDTIRVISKTTGQQVIVSREIDEDPENYNPFFKKGRNNRLPFSDIVKTACTSTTSLVFLDYECNS